MLFILYNNVVLSLFLRIFYYTFYTIFCTGYTYFLHILYIFYTYFLSFFSLFLRKNNALLVHYNALPCIFNAFSCVFSIIFCTFVQILRVFLCTLAQFFALPVSSFSVLLYKLFLHIARNCTCEARSFAQTFSSLPPHFFQLVRNFMTICFQLPCKISQLPTAFSYATTAFFPPFHFCFYCFFHS